MKRLLTLALGVAAMFTSCQKEETGLSPQGNEVTFNLAVDNGMATRAGEETPSRYIMELYTVESGTATLSERTEQAGTDFTVILKEETEYQALFYADYGTAADDTEDGNQYNASNLKALTIQEQPTKPCFAGAVAFTYDSQASEKTYLNPTLTHAVSQVNFVQGDEDFTQGNNKLSVAFPRRNQYDVQTGIASTLSENPIWYHFYDIAQASSNSTIGTSYIFATSSEPTVVDLSITFAGQWKAITNVPFQANYRTNIKGLFNNTYNSKITIDSEEGYDGNNDVDL